MRELDVSVIRDAVARLCVEANTHLPEDVKKAIAEYLEKEDWGIAKGVLENIVENYRIADSENVPICQDTGMACVFLEVGQDVHFVGGGLYDAVNEGVRRGYTEGYLRKSVVADPIRRGNTGDNTPAGVYTDIVPGDKVKITVGPKGFGSENMSAVKMLKPSDGLEGIKKFILDTVERAGPNPCPPMVVGVGIGGTFEKAAYLAKRTGVGLRAELGALFALPELYVDCAAVIILSLALPLGLYDCIGQAFMGADFGKFPVTLIALVLLLALLKCEVVFGQEIVVEVHLVAHILIRGDACQREFAKFATNTQRIAYRPTVIGARLVVVDLANQLLAVLVGI